MVAGGRVDIEVSCSAEEALGFGEGLLGPRWAALSFCGCRGGYGIGVGGREDRGAAPRNGEEEFGGPAHGDGWEVDVRVVRRGEFGGWREGVVVVDRGGFSGPFFLPGRDCGGTCKAGI